MEIKEYVNVKDYSTFKIGGQFRYFTTVKSIEDITEVFSFIDKNNLKFFVLGGGSNIVFSDGIIDAIALKMEIKGFKIIETFPIKGENDNYVYIKIGAGENWDDIVEKTINMNLSGLESLSAIPGTVGSTPVQNVGAYGTEVKDTIVEVEVFDTINKTVKTILNTECSFGYRDSIFKNRDKGRYIITSVIYRLNKIISAEIPNYPGVKKYFEENKIDNPTLKQIREAIIEIRKEKLPNTREIPNAGSFFKNPIVSMEIAKKIQKEFPKAKFFPIDKSHTKIPAGWLIENSGLKGKSFGNVSIYDKNALVLVNNGGATEKDILDAKNQIIKIVEDKFGIILEQEPEII
jgi:UDP-N-acetylmuramate dehydrogenase